MFRSSDIPSERPAENSRRDFLRQMAGVALLSALPSLAQADVHSQVEAALDNDEETRKEIFDRLAIPQIDTTLSPEVLQKFSNEAGFEVESATIVLRNRVSGESVRLLYGTQGEFSWHWTIAPNGMVPFMHNHVDEEEKIRIIQGSLSCFLNDKKQPVTVTASDGPVDFVIPKNTFHQPFNMGTQDVVGVVAFENPHEAKILSTVYWNMVHAGLTDKKWGKPNFLMLLKKTVALNDRTRIKGIPPFLQDFGSKMARFFGGITQEDLFAEFHQE